MHIETPLFDTAIYGRFTCDRCFDLGIWMTPMGDIQRCPNIAVGNDHIEPTKAATMIYDATEFLRERSIPANPIAFDIARMLARYTSEYPCPRSTILRAFFSYLPMSESIQIRKFHGVVEELRKNWQLPVGSRKDAPSGYWIITDVDDFAEWVERYKAAPITQLSTAHKIAKRCFPIFAEQMEIQFSNDVDTPDAAA